MQNKKENAFPRRVPKYDSIIDLIDEVEYMCKGMPILTSSSSSEQVFMILDILRILRDGIYAGGDNKSIKYSTELLQGYLKELDKVLVYLLYVDSTVKTILDNLDISVSN